MSKMRKRKRSFDAVDFADAVETLHIRDRTELLLIVKKQKELGKRDLPLYVLNNLTKAVTIMNTVWEMNGAAEAVERRSKERMQLMMEAYEGVCIENCNGQWLQMAKETLLNNNIIISQFSGALSQAIEKGRGKYFNILLTGGGNCCKTFLLKPLTKIFDAFCNPAAGSFAWLGVEEKEIVFLNDFRWERTILPWKDMLLLLEGDEVSFSAPKTNYTKDIKFTKDSPIFATADKCFQKGPTFAVENYMMTLRWRILHLTYEIPRHRAKKIDPCAKCFARLVFDS